MEGSPRWRQIFETLLADADITLWILIEILIDRRKWPLAETALGVHLLSIVQDESVADRTPLLAHGCRPAHWAIVLLAQLAHSLAVLFILASRA